MCPQCKCSVPSKAARCFQCGHTFGVGVGVDTPTRVVPVALVRPGPEQISCASCLSLIFLAGFVLWALFYVALYQQEKTALSSGERQRWIEFYARRDGLYLATTAEDIQALRPYTSILLDVQGDRIQIWNVRNRTEDERLVWRLMDDGTVRYGEVVGSKNRYAFAMENGHAYMNDATFDKVPRFPQIGRELITMSRIDRDLADGVKPAWPAP